MAIASLRLAASECVEVAVSVQALQLFELGTAGCAKKWQCPALSNIQQATRSTGQLRSSLLQHL